MACSCWGSFQNTHLGTPDAEMCCLGPHSQGSYKLCRRRVFFWFELRCGNARFVGVFHLMVRVGGLAETLVKRHLSWDIITLGCSTGFFFFAILPKRHTLHRTLHSLHVHDWWSIAGFESIQASAFHLKLQTAAEVRLQLCKAAERA